MIGRELKPHIGIFGRRNNGKSSIINCLTGQEIAIVSEIAGTTTDPVKKTMEIEGIGPVIFIDTAGIDDTGELGDKRVVKTKNVFSQIDFGILVITNNTFEGVETSVIDAFFSNDIPYIIVHNKSDLAKLNNELFDEIKLKYAVEIIDFNTKENSNFDVLVNEIKKRLPETSYKKNTLIGDLVSYGQTVMLITPIDNEAPEGRMILPQVQLIRDILDNDCIAVVLKEREVDAYIKNMNPKPDLAITDSQIFPRADALIPKHIPLTSFSIVLARQKGDFMNYLKDTAKLSQLKDGDQILILESCTHHVSCDDIGRIKIPRWLNSFTGKKLNYSTISGLSELPTDISKYNFVIQCGGCMITRKQVINRLRPFVEAGIPVTNYGMAIAYIHGIYNRAIQPFVKNDDNNTSYL